MQPERAVDPADSKTNIFLSQTPQQEHTEHSHSPQQFNSELQREQSISGHDESWDESLSLPCIHESQPPYEASGARAYDCFSECIRKHVLAVHSQRLITEEHGLSKVSKELNEKLRKEKEGYEEVQRCMNESFTLLRMARGKIARLNPSEDDTATDFEERDTARNIMRN